VIIRLLRCGTIGTKRIYNCNTKRWVVVYHWYLDVAFCEDNDGRIVDRVVVCNLDILCKLVLNVLWFVDVGRKDCGMCKKCNLVGWSLPKYIEQILSI